MTVTDEYFEDGFGFTDDEVKELLVYYNQEEVIEIVKDWYDGYQLGDILIYCPWDVIKYIQALRKNRNALPKNYWTNTSGSDMIQRFTAKADQTTRDEIEQLITGKAICKEIKQELTYKELDDSIENLWSVLLMTGYLTVAERISLKEYRLKIPNTEIMDHLLHRSRNWFKETARSDLSRTEKLCMAF